MSGLLQRLGQRAVGTLPRVEPLMRAGREARSVVSDPMEGMFTESFVEQDGMHRENDTPASDVSSLIAAERQVQQIPATRPSSRVTLDQVIAQIFAEPSRVSEESPRVARASSPTDPTHRKQISNDSLSPVRESATPPRERLHETERISQMPGLHMPFAPMEGQVEGGRTRDAQERSPMQAERRERADAVRQAPNVEISIGRIELHAAPAPQQQRSVAAPMSRSSLLTLDDYLSRRRGEQA
ncbi:hypothetical protein FTO74_12650 [Granulicella sp. WH15]|uniref:hypothetical protein n=1 Tax=Granulicella sp. WH15 TaxID=2602070 RepID=UPI00136760C3|nr:hypothetical protein [Granulicella sp. WH15]QHN04124.1 hypothetical protein FTO74_12650 [Granulicella sp. WH15]